MQLVALAEQSSLSRTASGKKRDASLLCHCYEVTEAEVRTSIDVLGAKSIEEVTRQTCAGAGCTACHCRIQRMLMGLPAKCGGSRFELCGQCGCLSAACACAA